MATVVLDLSGLVNGQPNDANDVVTNLQLIAAQVNGGLDSDNVDLTEDFAWTGAHSFTGLNKLKLPITDPTTQRSIAYQNQILKIHDGAQANVYLPFNKSVGTTYNMKVTYSSGTFKVVGIDGNDLSATNPGYVVLDVGGQSISVAVFTSSPSFQDDAHATDSDFVGTGTMSWGTTAATAWAQDMPFLLGVTSDGSTPYMVISRLPIRKTGNSTNIGYHDNAPSSASQFNVFALTTTNITSSHANCGITWIGSFRMRKSSSDDWTVQTLTYGEGIGGFSPFKQTLFNYPQGQNGAASGNHLTANGGTAPVFSSNDYFYSVDLSGYCHIYVLLNNDGGTDGSGAVNAQLTIPLIPSTSFATSTSLGVGSVLFVATSRTINFLINNGVANVEFYVTETGGRVTNANFANGNRAVIFSTVYKVVNAE